MALHGHARLEPIRHHPDACGDIGMYKTKLATGYRYPGRACLIHMTNGEAQVC